MGSADWCRATNIVIDSAGLGSNGIQMSGDHCTLSGFAISGVANDGVVCTAGDHSRVETGTIDGVGCDGVSVTTERYTISGLTIRASTGYGIHVASGTRNRIVGNDLFTAGTLGNFLDAGTSTEWSFSGATVAPGDNTVT